MVERSTRLYTLSWVVDLICFTSMLFCAKMIYSHSFVTDFSLQRITDFPLSYHWLWIKQRLFNQSLPESIIGPYVYLPNQQWIRLAKIERDTDGGVSYLLTRHLFRALSYTWGPAEGIPEDKDKNWVSITTNGKERMLPKNLVRASVRLATMDPTIHYWIDAVCIDQLNNLERSQQVSIMNKIYQKAEGVDIWLGKESSDTAEWMPLFQFLVDYDEQNRRLLVANGSTEKPRVPRLDEILPPNEWNILNEFESRRWFHRLWTLQEFVLAKEVNIMCGGYDIPWTSIITAYHFLHSRKLQAKLQYGYSTIRGTNIVNKEALSRLVLSPSISKFSYLSCYQNRTIAHRVDYETIIAEVYWRSFPLYASDPRDHVFGIIGIANAIADRLEVEYASYVIDYGLSVQEVYREFVVRVMSGGMGIRALSLNQRTLHTKQSGAAIEELPTWVPDLSSHERLPLSVLLAREVTHGRQKTCHNVLHHQSLDESPPFQVEGLDLHVHAHRIGHITQVSRSFPGSYDPEECVNFPLSLVKIFRNLTRDRHSIMHDPATALLETMEAGSDSSSHFSDKITSPSSLKVWLATAQEFLLWGSVYRTGKSVEAAMHDLPDLTWIEGIGFNSSDSFSFYQKARHEYIGLQVLGSAEIKSLARRTADICQKFISQFSAIAGLKIVVIATEDGSLLGIGPSLVQEGDIVWAVSGAEWPYVFRAGDDMDVFSFVGEAFVHGIMNGEYFENRNPQWQKVTLR